MLNRTARVAAAHAEEIARRRVMGAEPPQAIKMEDGKMGHTTGIPVSPNGVFQHHNAIRSATRGDKKYSLLDDGSQAAYHAVDFGVQSELTKAKATLATATEEAAKEAAQKAVQTRQAVVDKLRAEMPSDIIRGVPSYIKSLVRMIDPAERKRLKEELIAAYDGTQLDRIFANICDLIAFTDLPRDKTGHTVQALDVYDTLEQQITERKTLHHGLYSGLPYEQQRKANYDLALNLLPKLKTMAQDLSPTDGMTPKDKETWFNLFCTRAQSLIREAGFLIVTTTAGEPSIPTGNSKKGASINAANVDGGTPYTPPPSSSPAPSAPHSQLLGSSVNLVHTTPSTPPTTNPIYQSALPAPQQPAPGHKPVPGCCDWHAPVPGKDYGNRPPIGRPYDYARTQTVTAIRTSQGYPRDARRGPVVLTRPGDRGYDGQPGHGTDRSGANCPDHADAALGIGHRALRSDVNATTATQPVTSAAERTAPVPVAIPVAEPASPIRDLINAGLRRHDHTRMSAALAPVTSKKTPLFTRNFGRMHRPRPNAINPVARVAVTRSLTFAAAPSAKSTNSDADSVREPKTRTYCALGTPTSQQEGNVSKGSGRPTPNYKAPPAKMPEIDSLPAVEGCESLVPLCTDWLDNVAYNMHTRRVNNRMHVDGIQCTDWLRDGIPSSDQRQIHARTILYCPALQMLTTYLEPKGPGVCWARVRNAIDAEGDSEEARAHRFPKPHDNMYPVFTQASNYRTAVFTEDAHMPRRRDLSFANETEMEFFVIARDISGHAKNGRFPIP
eukprot:tig00021373_g21069.t1